MIYLQFENFIYFFKVWTVETTEMSSNWVGTRVAMLPMKKLEQLCAASEDELRVIIIINYY